MQGSAKPHVPNMSFLGIAISPPLPRDETVRVALLLVFAGGYLGAYSWIIHGVIANAETAKACSSLDVRHSRQP